MSEHQCDNCGAEYSFAELEEKGIGLETVPDLCQRLTPGCLTPSGECPSCSALVFPVHPDFVPKEFEEALTDIINADDFVKKEAVDGFHNERLANAHKRLKQAMQNGRDTIAKYYPERSTT